MQTVLIIPARLNSSRLPRKLLLDLGGHPVLWHTVQKAKQCKASRTILAFEDDEIGALAHAWGIELCKTGSHHENGTDRLAEAVRILGLKDEDIVVNVQGDEPFIHPMNIQQVAHNLIQEPIASIATLAEPIVALSELIDPSRVKVIRDRHQMALYFSRAPVPWDRARMPHQLPQGVTPLAHIGLYAYRVSFLKRYESLSKSPLEQVEALEQLRVLWHGEKIHVDLACQPSFPGIDTLEGLEQARQRILRESSQSPESLNPKRP